MREEISQGMGRMQRRATATLERRQKLEASIQYRDLVLTVATAIYVLLVQLGFVPFRAPFLIAIILLFGWNRAAAAFFRRDRRTSLVAWLSGVLDLAVCTVLIRETGGVGSVLLPLYFIVIVGAAAHVDARFGAVLLGLAGLSLSALAMPEAFGLPPAVSVSVSGAEGASDPAGDSRYRLIGILSLVAFLVPVLYSSATLAAKLRVRELQLEHANANLSVLYELGRALSDTLSTERVIETIVRGLSRAFSLARTELLLTTSEGSLRSIMRVPDSTRGGSDLDDSARLEELRHRLEQKGPLQEGRTIYLPIGTKARVLGLLVAEQPPPGRALNPDELNTIRLLAGQAGIAVENARLYETTERLSRTDGLTLLYNHRFFQERIREEFKRSDRFRQTLALLMIDVDDFKRINDTFGHQAGDRVLRRVARVLRESLRAVDVAARYGGDEFAIILPDTDLQEASEVAERLRRSVEKHPFFVGGTSVTLTLSLGAAARLPQSPVLSEELIKMADHALFQAKTGGRNTVATYPSE
jgi:diguanylate cyclase (GGDEF)-like protein